MRHFFDVIVVGGGPAGASLASRLLQKGRSVGIFEPVQANPHKIGENLPAASRPLLQELKFLEVVEEGGHLASYGVTSLWGSDQGVNQDHINQVQGLGWHLDRAQFDRDLRALVVKYGASLYSERVKKIERSDQWRVFTENQDHQWSARFLVDATGRTAWLARSLGVARHRDQDLVAVYAWQKCLESDHETRVLIESRPDGWWYSAQVPGQKRVYSFFSEAHKITDVKNHFLEKILETQQVKQFFNLQDPHLDVAAGEACGARLQKFYDAGWLAVGDAALSFDPISSQGIHNALYTGRIAADGIDEYLQQEDLATLSSYGQALENIRQRYQESQQYYYMTEARFGESPFWKKRQID